jgi:hypothetical protein
MLRFRVEDVEPVNPQIIRHFEQICAPRIAQCLTQQLGPLVRVEIVAHECPARPTRVRIIGHAFAHRHPHACHLNVLLTWDSTEIERLMQPDGEARFASYLHALGRKLRGWESARTVDFASRTQGEPEILIGGLDFET